VKKITFILMGFVLVFSSCKEDPPILPPDDNIETNGVVNGGFEDWVVKTQGAVEFDEPAGDFWASLNTLKFLGAPATAETTTDSYEGNFALYLESKAWGSDWVLPGIMVAGFFNVNANIGENLFQGMPIDTLPDYFSLYYKYAPATSDTAIFYSYLTRYNFETQKRDTIAEAHISILQQVDSYTYIELPYELLIQDIVPDTINIIMLTSASGESMKGHAGSALWIDEVKTGFFD
jgi:hypothetical protein